MDSFIGQVAASLYSRYGDGVSSLGLVFPSRRAQVFFLDALSSLADKPLWQPSFVSIDDLMGRIAGHKAGDRVRLVTELYKVWSRYHDESFDSFYLWGEILLSDFDAVDKYIADAQNVFRNLADLKAMDADQSFLSEGQAETIRRFWSGFGARDRASAEQEAFLKIWNTLYSVYTDYRKELSARGLVYTGMMHRMAAEKILAEDVPGEIFDGRYVFVGFNALTGCEKILFDCLRDRGVAEFYWDCDEYYMQDESREAGFFMRDNVERYPQTTPLPGGRDSFSGEKEIVAVSSPSDTLQCKYVNSFLSSLDSPDKETAIVLADESLLETLLYSIPEDVGRINVTMGYPLRQTLAYSFVERLLELQRNKKGRGFYHSDAVGLLGHPFVRENADTETLAAFITENQLVYPDASLFGGAGEYPALLYTPKEGWRELGAYLMDMLSRAARTAPEEDRLRAEFLSVTVEGIRKLCNSLEDCGVELSDRVFTSLLRRQLQGIRIPYEGEPLQGVQIMGFLETRALDFENVVILSAGDDLLPGNPADGASFIPYNLRAAYGLPTARHQESMYAYYFYRLLQRARRVHMVYCSRSDEKRRGEPSRYVYQLDYLSNHRVERRAVALEANVAPCGEIAASKDGGVLRLLGEFLETGSAPARRSLSPTALNAYIACPLRFYFRYIARIAPRDEVAERVDAKMLGDILHKALETIYGPLVGIPSPQDGIRTLIGSPQVDEAVERAVAGAYPPHEGEGRQGGGNLELVRGVIKSYINRHILPFDAARDDLERIEALELPLHWSVPLGEGRAVSLYGKADRVERLHNGLLRVADYKTSRLGSGSLVMRFRDVETLFAGDAKGATGAVVQTMLYAMMLGGRKREDVQPAVYAVRHLCEEGYSPLLQDRNDYVTRYSDYAVEFTQHLSSTLRGMFDPAAAFTQCADVRQCLHCDYASLCARTK